MQKEFKLKLAKGVGALAMITASATGASHFLGDDAGAYVAGNELGAVTLASAQMNLAQPSSAPSDMPAEALMPGNSLPQQHETVAAPPASDCTPSFDATLKEGAMVGLALSTPCAPNTQVTVKHEGAIFDVMTDANGTLAVEMPALAAIAMFEAKIDGAALRTIAAIPDFEAYERVALQWQGQTGLQIHALELGADYGTDGHVWANAAGTPERAVRARGGYIARLGDSAVNNGHLVEIYVFPAGMVQRGGTVRLSVEAEVNAFSCGTSVQGQALQHDGRGKMQATALTLEIPGCEAIGDILVLKNLLRDMKIASN